METVAYAGWDRCARLMSGEVEMLVTLDVGPRIIRLAKVGGRNQLHEDPDEVGLKGGTQFRCYGGHRLWTAPEHEERTYQPDNEAVTHSGAPHFSNRTDRFGIRKEIRIEPRGNGAFRLEHLITNEGEDSVEMAPWALTVMAPGGTCLVPQPEYKPFPHQLTPVRPIVQWSYSDMSDPRFCWGRRLIRLRQDRAMGPTKIGAFVRQGYAAYQSGDALFIKRFGAIEGETYPDFGCNFETFTRHDMLEVESLGPLRMLLPGQTAAHYESWQLLPDVILPEEENARADELAKLAATIPAA